MEEDKFAQKMIKQYTPKQMTKIDELKKLDKKAKQPANIFAYTFGVVGSLVLGLGLCLAMNILSNSTPLMIMGIIIGLVGIAMVSVNYLFYQKILQNSKNKYSEEIILKSNELLNK